MIPNRLQNILDDLKNQEWVQDLSQNAEIYVVGGSVRDAYLDKSIKDIDLIVDGLSFKGIQKILSPHGKQSLVGESFSVIKFKPHGYEGEDYDIAIPREDRKIGKGHKGFEIVTDGVDIMGDLKRRDFTINSMAVNVMTGELLDPFNGLKDLRNEIIKATDKNAFVEDPLRILRGIQFASRFDFDIDKGTMELMRKNAHLIKEITGERILEEFQKIIKKEGNTQRALNLIHQSGIDKALFDKEMLVYDKGFEKLDEISFYYMLAMVGDVDPYTFYMKRLKGEAKTGKAIKNLDNLISIWPTLSKEEDKKMLVFQTLNKSPEIADTVLLPPEAEDIIDEMKKGKIPMNYSDISISGDDIMSIFKIKGKEVGELIYKIREDALMNKYNWKNRNDSLDYLATLNY